jgi:D-sedoheptulose 7-phosphate isomerase
MGEPVMNNTTADAATYLQEVGQSLNQIESAQLQKLADAIYDCYTTGRTVFICGNGGSGANASHFCEDLGKGTLHPNDFDNPQKSRLKVISLTDNTAYILAWANDAGLDRIFSEQLKNLASAGDLLIAISGSGNSVNITAAVQWANDNGLTTFGCTGFDGGQLQQLAHHNLHVASHNMGLVESVHLTAFHWVLDHLYDRINA